MYEEVIQSDMQKTTTKIILSYRRFSETISEVKRAVHSLPQVIELLNFVL